MSAIDRLIPIDSQEWNRKSSAEVWTLWVLPVNQMLTIKVLKSSKLSTINIYSTLFVKNMTAYKKK